MQNSLPFGRVSLLIVGDFFQFPLFNQQYVLMKTSKGSYRLFNGWLWDSCMSWLKLFDRAVNQISLNCLKSDSDLPKIFVLLA